MSTLPGPGLALEPGPLPELKDVYWRHRVDPGSLRRDGRVWTLSTVGQVVPFLAFAVFLGVAAPITIPLAVILLVHAWMVPALYAARGANVVRPKRRDSAPAAEQRALGMLADLLDREAYALYMRTGLALEPGALGVWLIGESGALLLAPGGRRVHCYCVAVRDPGLPVADRVAHLLLALRCDENGFATVANRAFVGAPWRLRLVSRARPALDVAVARARALAVSG
ncbi:MAG TPA: hypothetical protein VFN55_07030 [Solirubrobacteraceae bacterium]|nr:hypothetical protein [Solirubrobacteraceae bacterium]